MELESIINQMQANAETIAAFLAPVSDDQAHWKPQEDQWSMLEVINHLCDEERLDFSAHLKECLEGKPWSPINPVEWVMGHGYAQKKAHPSLEFFLQARLENLIWLPSLQDADWQQRIVTPFGSISAGELLHSWLAHDFLHIRQLNELHYAFAAHKALPYKVFYAGDW
jgi:uncharacterized damage-inducible protein DinB